MDSGIGLHGQVALVTGSGRGIGRAIARALAAAGAKVAVLSRSADQVDETVALIRGDGGRALALAGDVTDRAAVGASVREAADRICSSCGGPSCPPVTPLPEPAEHDLPDGGAR